MKPTKNGNTTKSPRSAKNTATGADKEHLVSATYRKVKGECSSHADANVVVEEILLDEIRRITAYAREHED